MVGWLLLVAFCLLLVACRLSVVVSCCQLLSVVVSCCRLLSVVVSCCQWLSVVVGCCWLLLVVLLLLLVAAAAVVVDAGAYCGSQSKQAKLRLRH